MVDQLLRNLVYLRGTHSLKKSKKNTKVRRKYGQSVKIHALRLKIK